MAHFAKLQVLLLLVLVCSCSARSSVATVETAAHPPNSALPALQQLPRAGSSTNSISGSSFASQTNGTVNGPALELNVPASGPGSGLGYGVYIFDSLTYLPMVLNVATDDNFDARLWIAFANWNTGRWDFNPEYFYGDIDVAPSESAIDTSVYLDGDGRFAVAIVMVDPGEVVSIESISLEQLDDVTNFEVSTDRWDGIKLTWTPNSKASAYNVYRRRYAPGITTWDLLTPDPISRIESELLDIMTGSGINFEYRLSAGKQYMVDGQLRWVWTPGVQDVGRKIGSIIGSDVPDIESYVPFNCLNFLSFMYISPENPGELGLIRSKYFPPLDNWVQYDQGVNGFGPFGLNSVAFQNTPCAIDQQDALNNRQLTLGFSTASGTFTQVGIVSDNGDPAWEAPIEIMEQGTQILQFTDVPRHIIAMAWNTDRQRMEINESIDPAGREWFDHNPFDMPWQNVGNKVPGSKVQLSTISAQLHIAYMEAQSGEIVLYKLSDHWEDLSPGVTTISRPQVFQVMNGLSPAKGMIFATADGKLNLMPLDFHGVWSPDAISELPSGPSDSPVSEFDVYANAGVSYNNNLAYVKDGNLYCTFSDSASFTGWTDPVLIDNSGTCREIDIVQIGSDNNFTNYLFLTYLADDEHGVARLNFRDLKLIRSEI